MQNRRITFVIPAAMDNTFVRVDDALFPAAASA
jgi:hypothetical protein